MSKCDLAVSFDRADRTYRTGEKIAGEVRVRVHEDCDCKGLTVSCGWRTHGAGDEDKGDIAERMLFQGAWQARRDLAYRFEFEIPHGPLTYHGSYVNVDWYVAARASLPWVIDAKAEEDFLVLVGAEAAWVSPGPEEVSYKRTARGLADGKGQGTPLLGRMQDVLAQRGESGAAGVQIASAFLSLFGCLVKVFGAFFVGFGILFTLLVMGGVQSNVSWPFGLIFVGIGAVILWLSFRPPTALRKLGPVAIVVEPDVAHPGDTVSIAIRFQPRMPVRVESVTVDLICREEADKRVGTDTSRSIREAHRASEWLDPPGECLPGRRVELRASFRIPEDALYTFVARNNRIVWLLMPRIWLRKWPDWKVEYPFTVRP